MTISGLSLETITFTGRVPSCVVKPSRSLKIVMPISSLMVVKVCRRMELLRVLSLVQGIRAGIEHIKKYLFPC